MTLFDQVVSYVRSAGHAIESEEHKLLNEFVTYLASNSVVAGFFQNSGTEQEHEVVANFASSLMPAEQFVQPDLAALAAAPAVEETPAVAAFMADEPHEQFDEEPAESEDHVN